MAKQNYSDVYTLFVQFVSNGVKESDLKENGQSLSESGQNLMVSFIQQKKALEIQKAFLLDLLDSSLSLILLWAILYGIEHTVGYRDQHIRF